MNDYIGAVRAFLHIAFDAICPNIEGCAKGSEGVFPVHDMQSAMRKNKWSLCGRTSHAGTLT